MREARIREKDLYDEKEVLKNIKRIDRERRLSQILHGRDWQELDNYDLVINTTHIGVDGGRSCNQELSDRDGI